MISISKIISILDKTNFKGITLPNNDKFLQINAVTEKKQYIDNIVNNSSALNQTSLGNVITTNLDIFQKQSSNNQNTDSLNSSNQDAINKIEELEKNKLINTVNYKIYFTNKENSKIPLPELLLDVFKKYNDNKTNLMDFNNLNINKVYMYGTKNPESYFKSLLYLTKHDFITKNKFNMNQDILNFKKQMSFNIDDFYDMNNYKYVSNKVYKKTNLVPNLLHKETYTDEGIYYLSANYLNQNLIILNLQENKFYLSLNMPLYSIDFEDLLRMKDERFYFIVNYNNCYLPVFYHNIDNLFDINLLKVLLDNFELENKQYFSVAVLKQKIEIYNMREEAKRIEREQIEKNRQQSRGEYNTNFKDGTEPSEHDQFIQHVIENLENRNTEDVFDNMFKDNEKYQEHTKIVNEQNKKRNERTKRELEKRKEVLEQLEEKEKKESNSVSDTNTNTDSKTKKDSKVKSKPKKINKSSKESSKENSKTKTKTKSKLELDDISKYKLIDLQNLANDNNINIKKEAANGKMKNRTKQELYNDLKKI